MNAPRNRTKPLTSSSRHRPHGSGGTAAPSMPREEQTNLILGILSSFLEEDGLDQLGGYLDHVGFDIGAIRRTQDLPNAWLGHYRLKQGTYDVDRACRDLANFPPIAAEIFRLENVKKGL